MTKIRTKTRTKIKTGPRVKRDRTDALWASMGMPTNGERGDKAEGGLLPYYEPNWERCREHRAQALGDLLCDLQHFARKYGIRFEDCLRTGTMNFQAEVRGQL